MNQKQCLEGFDALIMPRRISSSVTTGEYEILKLTTFAMKLKLTLVDLIYLNITVARMMYLNCAVSEGVRKSQAEGKGSKGK